MNTFARHCVTLNQSFNCVVIETDLCFNLVLPLFFLSFVFLQFHPVVVRHIVLPHLTLLCLCLLPLFPLCELLPLFFFPLFDHNVQSHHQHPLPNVLVQILYSPSIQQLHFKDPNQFFCFLNKNSLHPFAKCSFLKIELFKIRILSGSLPFFLLFLLFYLFQFFLGSSLTPALCKQPCSLLCI